MSEGEMLWRRVWMSASERTVKVMVDGRRADLSEMVGSISSRQLASLRSMLAVCCLPDNGRQQQSHRPITPLLAVQKIQALCKKLVTSSSSNL
jgi:hypothetical protein